MEEVISKAIDFLTSSVHDDGGWGYTTQNRQSFIEPTCRILVGLADLLPASGTVTKAISFIMRSQNNDGGWSNWQGLPSDITTSHVAWALSKYPSFDVDAAILDAVTWIKRNELPNGKGWGWCQGTTGFIEPNTYAIIALCGCQSTITIDDSFAQFIFDLRCEDGGWNCASADKNHIKQGSQANTTALGAIALSKLGSAKYQEEIAQSVELLKREVAINDFGPYSLGTILWSLGELGFALSDPVVNRIVSKLTKMQNLGGDWQSNNFWTAIILTALVLVKKNSAL